ncbi:MAG: histidine phosphatase family protein [Clostridia bacterium]|nr:histidine phosphatase family protein [Clostridia bacterium]
MLLYYIRHGDPIYSPDSLTSLGIRQAEAVAKRLAMYGIDEIYSSTSNRAIMTATPTSQICKKDITELDFCNESHAWKYLTITDDDGKKHWCFQDSNISKLFYSDEIYSLRNNWYEHPDIKKYNFKEGCENLKKSCDDFLFSLGFQRNNDGTYNVVKQNDKRIALFAHEGFGMFFLSNLLDIPYPTFCTRFGLNHSGMTVIYFDEKKRITTPRLLTLSNDSHIYKEGLPTKYNNKFTF